LPDRSARTVGSDEPPIASFLLDGCFDSR